jgi:hypothetical protein
VTRVQAAGVLLIALGLVYGLLYAAWLRKRRRHTSAAVVVERSPGASGGTVSATRGRGTEAEGTYVSTTTATSRHERVAVGGLGNRSRATMVVCRDTPAELVRFRREGEADVVIAASRLLRLRRDRGMAGKFVGGSRLLVLQWRADDGTLYETGFLPRYRADLDRLESALWWHGGGASMRSDTDDQPARPSAPPAEPRPAPGDEQREEEDHDL